MNILITGGLGFIGTNLSTYLHKKGYFIKIIDNASKKGTFENYNLLKQEGISNIEICDIRRYEDLKLKINDTDLIIHLAANCSTIRSITYPLRDFEVNALGTVNMLEIAKEKHIPFIYTSTCKVYSPKAVNKSDGYIDESMSVLSSARSPYGSSKLVGEIYCQEYSELYDVPVVVNRISSVFGLYQYGTEEAGWIYWFCEAIHKDYLITIYGDGNQIRDPLWVEDFCSLVELEIINISNYKGMVFNVGGGSINQVSLKDVIKYLEKKKGCKANVQYQKARLADLNVYVSNMARLSGVSEWKPKTSVYEGIDKVYNFIQRIK